MAPSVGTTRGNFPLVGLSLSPHGGISLAGTIKRAGLGPTGWEEERQIEYDKPEENQERGTVEGQRVGMKGRMRSPVEEGLQLRTLI